MDGLTKYFNEKGNDKDRIPNLRISYMVGGNIEVEWSPPEFPLKMFGHDLTNRSKFQSELEYNVCRHNLTKTNHLSKEETCKGEILCMSICENARYDLFVECTHPKFGIIARSDTIQFFTSKRKQLIIIIK
ncbi:hypothetical protein RFI_19768 [Reticulomyxa filosa]|uniref:Fibronectin type-III domain-containing protein n=1 Tax=Reticulomyxa filosa TaxID=46433 RepID=X6MU89_RETFI|nr:hypothetical protein RFI_19768 [Reticulomyxa filosa]|eukprot:ETO17553.1 hypothetical protein RFI_19768 [Reticulomyxa filosa]